MSSCISISSQSHVSYAYKRSTFPPWQFTEEILELKRNNLVQWKQNLENILTKQDYRNLLESLFMPAKKKDHKTTAFVRHIFSKGIMQEVTDLLPDPNNFTPTPHIIVSSNH